MSTISDTSGLFMSMEQYISNVSERRLAVKIMKLFIDRGLICKIKGDGSRYRIFCYIKKCKESVILGTLDNRKDFIIQLRISDRTVFNKLDDLSENIRVSMLNGPNCKETCFRKCEKSYVFNYHNEKYRKCQALICNFIFRNIQQEDINSLLGLINNEIENCLI